MNLNFEVIDMSIKEIKEEIISNVEEYATNEGKKAFLKWIVNDILPHAKEIGQSYIECVRDNSVNSTGWCKMRDTTIIPAIISGALWGIEKLINKAVEAE